MKEQNPADTEAASETDERVDVEEIDEQSFPASDPPPPQSSIDRSSDEDGG